ncbi:FecCD family ABC transporter permease [Gephyromycinifex aptenodytis]|uniref:FecCD family ABC transporter permease n=1 Tax=Gephyromycinifex aptenodytis TaxID=2716227 RepID=UPI001447F0D6|nr:iron chelate uptake ABC transporter family permease subunit [Gephyromycinifex aptenodytis]
MTSNQSVENLLSFKVLRFGDRSVVFHPRAVVVSVLLLAALLGTAFLGLHTGSSSLSTSEVLTGLSGGEKATIVQQMRLPRVLCGAVVGASLGMAGSVFQSLTRNVLGSPDIIGVTSGAAMGAVTAIVLFRLDAWAVALAALAGCLGASALTWAISHLGVHSPGQRLVLVGIGVGAFCQSVTAVILTQGNPATTIMGQSWLAGTLNARTWPDLLPATIGIVLTLPVLIGCARHLNTLEAGEDMALQLGVAVPRLRSVTVTAGVVLCALAVCSVGPIAFIALASPHIARSLTRSGTVPIVPAALTGSTTLLAADILGQSLPENLRMPVGLASSLLGGAYMLFILTRRSR